MGIKKVKINGEWQRVDEKDIQDSSVSKKKDIELSADEIAQATKLGEAMAKGMTDKLKIGDEDKDVSELSKQVKKLIEQTQPADSKLLKILSGKDLYADKSELTKEEKIVGFYYALVTGNEAATKALAEGVDADGGFLFPNEFFTELVREIPNINVMRQWIRIIPMKRDTMDITNLVSGPQVFWTGENVAKSTTTARFSRLTLNARKLTAILYSSDELIEDSDIFDVVKLIIDLFAEAVADEEERVIWVGDGTTQPQGIDTAGTIATIAAVNQDFDDIINLHFNLPRKYRRNAQFYVNDKTMSEIRKLKDSNNNYIVQNFSPTANQQDSFSTLLGKQVIISDWVPDNTIFFMNAKILYFLGDRKRMSVKISQDTTQAFVNDQTAIRIVTRIAGEVVQPLAGRELTGF